MKEETIGKKEKEAIAWYGALKMVRKLITELQKQEASIVAKIKEHSNPL